MAGARPRGLARLAPKGEIPLGKKVTGGLLVVLLLTAALLAAAPPASAALPTGTFTSTGGGGDCFPGFTCSGFKVSCGGLDEAANGDIAKRTASGARGTLVFFQAGGGGSYAPESPDVKAFFDDMHDAGFTLVQVRWDKPWYKSAPNESAGYAKVACRPATAIKWIETNLYSEKSHKAGACGFCLIGASGGASAIAYAPAFYGMDSLIDAAILIGGPPHAALAKGCLGTGGPGYAYASHTARNIDDAYGYPTEGGGPCEQHDASFKDRWDADSVESGGSDYSHGSTRFTFLFGEEDHTVGPPHGRDYVAKLKAVGNTTVEVENVPGMQHSQWATAAGIKATQEAVMGSGTSGGTGGTGGTGGGTGSGGGGGSGGSPTPSVSASPSTPSSPTSTPTGSPSATEPPGLALPDSDENGFPASALLLLLAPVVGYVLYRILRGQSLIPRRKGGEP